jgi:hypothetical protein
VAWEGAANEGVNVEAVIKPDYGISTAKLPRRSLERPINLCCKPSLRMKYLLPKPRKLAIGFAAIATARMTQ